MKAKDKQIEEATLKRDAWLESLEEPMKTEMINLQKEINKKLKRTTNQSNRLVIINTLMMEKVNELSDKLHELIKVKLEKPKQRK